MWQQVTVKNGDFQISNPDSGTCVPVLIFANGNTGEIKLFASKWFDSDKEKAQLLRLLNKIAENNSENKKMEEDIDDVEKNNQPTQRSRFSSWTYNKSK